MLPLRESHWPTGWEGGARGSPESEDLPFARLEPLAEGGFVTRLSRTLVLTTIVVVATIAVPTTLAVNVHVRVEGKTQTIFGPTEPVVDVPANALDALRTTALLGEFYLHVTTTSFGPYVDQIGLFPASASSGWVFKLNNAAGQVGADQTTLKDGDTLLWYWADFDPTTYAGPKTLVLKKTRANCYAASLADDKGTLTPAAGATLRVGSKRTVSTSAGTACVGPHRGLLVRAALQGAVRSNALA
jgi:hypothetical protein